MRALLLCSLFCASAVGQDQWVGQKFMPKSGAKIMNGNREVSSSEIIAPYVVRGVKGEWLELDRGFVRRTDVVPIDDAAAYYTEYLRNKPGSAWAYHERGIVWKEKGELDKALRDYNEAIRLGPKDAASYNSLGLAWKAKGELDNAFKDYTEAIRLDPKYAAAYTNRGTAWNAKGEPDNALKDYSEAIRLDPKFDVAYNNRAWLRATASASIYRNGKLAVADATKSCELTSWKNPESLDTLAAAYAESGDFSKAVEWQTKAMSMAPESEKADYRSRLDLYQSGKPFRG